MEVKAFYDGISRQYDALRFADDYSALINRLERGFVLRHCRAGRVLEIGAGTGRITAALARRAEWLTAVDLSAEMLGVLRTRLSRATVTVRQLDLLELDRLDGYGEFDTVVCLRVLPHVPDLDAALARLRGCLRPGGNAVFDLWNRRSPYWCLRTALGRGQVFTRFMTPAEMARAIQSAGFRIEDALGWGYLMPVRRLLPRLDHTGLARAFYAIEHLGRTRLKRFAHSVLFNCVTRETAPSSTAESRRGR